MFVIDTGVADLRNYDIGETLRCKVITTIYTPSSKGTICIELNCNEFLSCGFFVFGLEGINMGIK